MTVALNAGNVPTNRVDLRGKLTLKQNVTVKCVSGENGGRAEKIILWSRWRRLRSNSGPCRQESRRIVPAEPQVVGQFGFVGRAILPATGFQPALAA